METKTQTHLQEGRETFLRTPFSPSQLTPAPLIPCPTVPAPLSPSSGCGRNSRSMVVPSSQPLPWIGPRRGSPAEPPTTPLVRVSARQRQICRAV
ncbi:hypothetical protein KIL84_002659 [Mauremys mutica]|uniref:Uncharacterized protein n=1 Tax=Mauremys mutica TaxID=74926 RepID=A0A9D4ASR2_9SAUR|nr:hypothetical protein KIL84_002659 [Mauremys mutica]